MLYLYRIYLKPSSQGTVIQISSPLSEVGRTLSLTGYEQGNDASRFLHVANNSLLNAQVCQGRVIAY